MHWKNFGTLIFLLIFISGYQIADAQQNLAQQAYTIFEQNCFVCHDKSGPHANALTIQYAELIEKPVVIPGAPAESRLYTRLISPNPILRMPQGQPPLDDKDIQTIHDWIKAGAPDWEVSPEPNGRFITTEAMLKAIYTHVESLNAFNRPFARYFTLTHLYNAGETGEALRSYQNALSKLINSLSWGSEVIRPIPIDVEETIYYIDLRNYEWEKNNKWYEIEQEYPYDIDSKSPMYATLRQELDCQVPFVHADWFIAKASLSPLYYEILDLPKTDKELEEQLRVNVKENIQNAPGIRVWRAGFNESGVSRNNRIVERHRSPYGAYWKTYDFEGNVGTRNIFAHPLDFEHDGGEIIFNLPNGLQAYYLSDASGERLDKAPINIVSDTGARDPIIYNGLSCMGCHTEGMKPFEDQVRPAVNQTIKPSYNPKEVLRLYVKRSVMDELVSKDKERYRKAVEAVGSVFGGIEPIQQLVRQFEGTLDAAHAAAEVGLEETDFLQKIRENPSLQNLGLQPLISENGTVQRDAWASQFSEMTFILDLYTNIVPNSAGESQFNLDMVPVILDDEYAEVSARSVAFSRDGGILAIGGDDGTIQLWDAGTNKHLKTLVALKSPVDILAFTPDGHTLLSGQTQIISLGLWDVDLGRRHKRPGIVWASKETTLINIVSTVNGSIFAVTGDVTSDKFGLSQVKPTDDDLSDLSDLLRRYSSGHGVPVDVIAFSPDGSILASGSSKDKVIHIWDTVTGLRLKTLIGHNSGVLSIAFSPDGRVLASGSDGEILLWNAGTGQQLQTLVGYTDGVSSLAFNVNGRILAGGSNGEVLLWDVVTGKQFKKLLVDGYVNGIAFSPDGSRLTSAAGGSLNLWDITLSMTSVPQPPQLADVNGDGSVNVQDLVVVASNFGKTGDNAADVNKDGMVNIADLVLIANALSDAAAAPSLRSVNSGATLTKTEVQQWLSEAEQLDLTDPSTQRGILFLEQLLAALTPTETTLLPNYPNPFNPETWIPYQLAKAADVTVTISAVDGIVVRTLSLGHQPVGIYQDKSRAVYWDGKNAHGEPVASGVYFYTLTAGEFTATRKMLIRK